jgi:RimJ/RimL family protein N-acetyltransferase
MTTTYLFTSQRLGFRNWTDADIATLAAINADPEVMEFFPAMQDLQQTKEFLTRMQDSYAKYGYCYFAVDLLQDNTLIGFIGLAEKTFEADFTPCVDIGWRISKEYWNQGYATEGAQRCLRYALYNLNLPKVVAIAPVVNVKSIRIMEKIGMKPAGLFSHPLLLTDQRLCQCALYEARREE